LLVRTLPFCCSFALGCGDSQMASPDAPIAEAVVDASPDAVIDAGPITRSISGGGMTDTEVETHLATNGRGTIVAAWIGVVERFGLSTNGYAISRDDGLTWTRPAQVDSPGGALSSDPTVAVDVQGNLYMAWIGFQAGGTTPTDMHIYLA